MEAPNQPIRILISSRAALQRRSKNEVATRKAFKPLCWKHTTTESSPRLNLESCEILLRNDITEVCRHLYNSEKKHRRWKLVKHDLFILFWLLRGSTMLFCYFFCEIIVPTYLLADSALPGWNGIRLGLKSILCCCRRPFFRGCDVIYGCIFELFVVEN